MKFAADAGHLFRILWLELPLDLGRQHSGDYPTVSHRRNSCGMSSGRGHDSNLLSVPSAANVENPLPQFIIHTYATPLGHRPSLGIHRRLPVSKVFVTPRFHPVRCDCADGRYILREVIEAASAAACRCGAKHAYLCGARKPVGLVTLPPDHPADVFFDMEGYPLVSGGLEYLFGVCSRTRKQAAQFLFCKSLRVSFWGGQ